MANNCYNVRFLLLDNSLLILPTGHVDFILYGGRMQQIVKLPAWCWNNKVLLEFSAFHENLVPTWLGPASSDSGSLVFLLPIILCSGVILLPATIGMRANFAFLVEARRRHLPRPSNYPIFSSFFNNRYLVSDDPPETPTKNPTPNFSTPKSRTYLRTVSAWVSLLFQFL
jgi:hypothetical protein